MPTLSIQREFDPEREYEVKRVYRKPFEEEEDEEELPEIPSFFPILSLLGFAAIAWYNINHFGSI